MGRINSKKKGNLGELEFAKLLTEAGFPARRSSQYCGQSGEAADNICESLADWFIEVKRVQNLNVEKAFRKAKGEAGLKNRKVLLAHRKNHGEWLVTVDWEVFRTLISSNPPALDPI